MKYSEGKTGRIFVLRLENKDRLPETLEIFAKKMKINRAMCIIVGGINSGGKIVTGPEKDTIPVNPMLHTLIGVHEIAGVGTLFPDEKGNPRLHMHAAFGRKGTTRTGCIRPGIETWKLGELIILEIKNNRAKRIKDKTTGFEMLEP